LVRLESGNVETPKRRNQRAEPNESPEHGPGSSGSWLWLLTYFTSSYLAAMTHYFAVLALFGQVVFVAARARGRTLRRIGLAGLAAVAFFAITWGPSLAAQVPLIFDQAWLLEPRSDHLWRTLLRVLNPPIRFLFAHPRFVTQDTMMAQVVLSAGGVILLAGLLTILWRARCREASLFFGWYVIPLVTLAAVDLATHRQLMSHLRYLCVACPALVALVAVALDEVGRWIRWLALGAGALAAAMTLPLPTQENPQNRQAAALIAGQAEAGGLLLFDARDWPPFWAARIYHGVAYYLDHPGRRGTSDDETEDTRSVAAALPFVLLREPPSPELRVELADYKRVVLVHPPGERDPNPLPGQFRLVGQTGYVDLVGFIYLFERVENAE
jgi:hypothetical protein